MPKAVGAQKAYRQSVTRHARNLKRAKILKGAVKDFRKLVAAGKKDEAKAKLSGVYATLDKSAKVNFIKKNKARRLKSRLSKLLK